jgi:hypothetical protein
MCTVQTAHGTIRPLDRSAIEYPTCATIPGPLHQVSNSYHDPRRCMHAAPAHHEISKYDSPNETKVKEKQSETIPDSNSNLTKSMTHHNQTKKLITWFLNLPLDESIDNKSTKFKVQIQDPMKHS